MDGETVNITKIDKAIQYFSALRARVFSREDLQIRPSSKEERDYFDALTIAGVSANELSKYGGKGLEFLASQGLRLLHSESLVYRIGIVEAVNKLKDVGKIGGLDSSFFGDCLDVLFTHREILQYEERVEDYRKLRAVDEAMRKFKGA